MRANGFLKGAGPAASLPPLQFISHSFINRTTSNTTAGGDGHRAGGRQREQQHLQRARQQRGVRSCHRYQRLFFVCMHARVDTLDVCARIHFSVFLFEGRTVFSSRSHHPTLNQGAPHPPPSINRQLQRRLRDGPYRGGRGRGGAVPVRPPHAPPLLQRGRRRGRGERVCMSVCMCVYIAIW